MTFFWTVNGISLRFWRVSGGILPRAASGCGRLRHTQRCRPRLMQFLYEDKLLDKLTAYGGWNTSSNTLGTVLAHLSACHAAEKAGTFTGTAQQKADEFLFLCYLEDWGYMACVRRGVTALLPTLRPDMDFSASAHVQPGAGTAPLCRNDWKRGSTNICPIQIIFLH